MLATERRAVDGRTAVWVYRDRVVTMALRIPYNYNDWQTIESRAYNTPEELKAALAELTKPKTAGMWS